MSLNAQAVDTQDKSPQLLFDLGTGSDFSAVFDAMLPIYSSQKYILMGGLAGKYATDTAWTASCGMVARHLTENEKVLGILMYVDQTQTKQGDNFWFINPGLEFFNGPWDFHFNSFLGMSDDRQTQATFFADEVGFEQGIILGNHSITALKVNLIDELGNSLNGEVGYTEPRLHNTRFALGGYHNRYPTAENATGAEVKITVPISEFTVNIADSYDKVFKNSFRFSVSFYFDRQNRPLLFNQMYSPPIRYLGALNTGANIHNQFLTEFTGEAVLRFDNLWFFSSASNTNFDSTLGTNNCTGISPCSAASFTQVNVDTISALAPETKLLFASGTYLANPGASDNTVILANGQSIEGRSANFKFQAFAANRPIFQGTIGASGNNSFNNINITGSGSNQNVGFITNGATNVTLTNVQISDYATQNGAEPVAMQLENLTNAKFNNVSVKNIIAASGINGGSGSDGNNGGNATGILLDNGDQVSFNNVTVTNVQGGSGGNGGNGTNGADTNNVPGAAAGNGTNAGHGGDAGSALGFSVVNSTNVYLNAVTISAINAGHGGHAGHGGNGGSAAITGLGDNTGAVGGTGGQGGTGGNGNTALGLNISNSTAVNMNVLNVTDISGGNAGRAGRSGHGGGASTEQFSAAGQSITASAGQGGDGANGGVGGNGGNAIGLAITNSSIIYNTGDIANIKAGTAAAGTDGGRGGSADVKNIDQTGLGDLTATGGSAGAGGTGGEGGRSGTAVGMTSDQGVIDLNRVSIREVKAYQGGNGGNGAQGGNSVLDRLDEEDAGELTGTSGAAGQAGSGGVGGDSGSAFAIKLDNSSQLNMQNGTILQITSSASGKGGSGAKGGDSSASNLEESATVNLSATAGPGGNGGAGGAGGFVGAAYGIKLDSSTAKVDQSQFSQIIAANSGAGGAGGDGGDSLANGNTLRNFGILNAIADIAGNGGDSGATRAGGQAAGIIADNSSSAEVNQSSIEVVIGGYGGDGSHGGNGGDANANNNAVLGGSAGSIEAGTGGTGGNGADAGIGGDANTTFATAGSTLTTSAITTSDLTGGNGGNGGNGGAGGNANTTGTSAGNSGTLGTPGSAGAGGAAGVGGVGGSPNGTAGSNGDPGEPGQAIN